MTENITLPRATVQQLLEALKPYISYGRVGSRDVETAKAISAERRLRTALEQQQARPVPVQHTHQWFSTGAMEPGQMRCIDCGVWGLSGQPQTPKVERLPTDDTEGGAV